MSMHGFPPILPLASLAAARPVFMILMGLALLLVAWRLTRLGRGWPARMMMAGAVLLAFGYAVVIPLYTVGVIMPMERAMMLAPGETGSALAWHLVKLFAMNGGWLFFGLGIALMAHGPSPLRREVKLEVVR